MRKIVVYASVSMDGVMQSPGGADEDRSGSFTLGGWQAPYRDPVGGEELQRVFSQKFDLLLGRKTYDTFANFWPTVDETAPHGGIAKLFNSIKKYVVSSGEVASWTGSVLLSDIEAVKRLRQEDGPALLTQGSSMLVHALLAHDLVDAISIFTIPVVLGGGKRLFADGSAPHSFKLISSRVTPLGVMIGHYERDAW